MTLPTRLTVWDGGLMGILLLAALVAWPLMRGPEGARVIVERDGRVLFSAPLDTHRRVSLDGPYGPTVVLVEQGQVRIESSSCPRHLCQRQGSIQRQGQMLVCLPNRLLVRICGPATDANDYDFLSR